MFEYVRLSSGGDVLPDVSHLRPFRCLLIAEYAVDKSRRNEVSTSLVESGCLYFCAWGADCSLWELAADLSCLERSGFEAIPDDCFVMTTSHVDDPLEEVFWYFKNLAFHATVDIANSLVVHFGESCQQSEFADAFANA